MSIILRKISGASRKLTDSWWSVCIIALLVGFILYQRWQFLHPVRPAPPALLKIGERLPRVSLKDLSRKSVDLDWKTDSRPTAIYVFRPDCAWCKRNLESLRTLVRNSTGYRFVGVSTAAKGVDEYLAKTKLPFPVYVAQDTAGARQLKLSVTPETVVVSPDGMIVKVWAGAYTGRVATEVEQTFGVKLPDIGNPSPEPKAGVLLPPVSRLFQP